MITKAEFMIREASVKAKFAKRVWFYCSKSKVEQTKQQFLEHNDGAWPIGLKVVGQ